MTTVAVLDYGMGNLHSVAKALEHVGASKVIITHDPALVRAADRVVFPGVGAMRDCIAGMKAVGVDKDDVDRPIFGTKLQGRDLAARHGHDASARFAKNGRVHGVAPEGVWMHVGDPQARVEAEAKLAGLG